jgi:tetratricopeptide (TPR) repeat protein
MLAKAWGAVAVTVSNRIRLQKILREAQGYLELGLPQQALAALDRIQDAGTFRAHVLYLRGEALRSMQQYAQAIEPLEQAGDLAPSNFHIWLALGWCYKRVGRIDLAVAALKRAEEVAPNEALIQYNLACYYSLAENKQPALYHLRRALRLEPGFAELTARESDFDPIRADPDFQALTHDAAARARRQRQGDEA